MIKSVIGCANQTPFNPINLGKIRRSGISKIICRKITNPIESLDCPMDWKKFGPVVASPQSGEVNKYNFNPLTVEANKRWSELKNWTSVSGMSWIKINPIVKIVVSARLPLKE